MSGHRKKRQAPARALLSAAVAFSDGAEIPGGLRNVGRSAARHHAGNGGGAVAGVVGRGSRFRLPTAGLSVRPPLFHSSSRGRPRRVLNRSGDLAFSRRKPLTGRSRNRRGRELSTAETPRRRVSKSTPGSAEVAESAENAVLQCAEVLPNSARILTWGVLTVSVFQQGRSLARQGRVTVATPFAVPRAAGGNQTKKG